MENELNDYEINLNLGEPEDNEDVEPAVSQDSVKYTDPGWNEYVMSHFLPSELYDEKYPTLNGMRRVAELLLGHVVSSKPTLLNSTLDPTCNGRAYCVYEIQINDFLGTRHFRTFCGAADSWEGNTAKDYAIYPTAIAEGRAEARAYRKALLLTTVAAEEIKGKEKSFESVFSDKKVEEYNENKPISHGQKVAIGHACKRKGIDKDELIAKYLGDKKELTRQDGIDIMGEINALPTNK